MRFVVRYIAVAGLCLLAGCDAMDRSRDAALARREMIGMTKEEVLICMGPPGRKMHVNNTEVWSYHSTNGAGYSNSVSQKYSGFTLGESSHSRSFCDVNVVMNSGIVTRVNYNGPRGGSWTRDEQCAYAVENCITPD